MGNQSGDLHGRAVKALKIVLEFTNTYVRGWQLQIDDATQVANSALSGSYPSDRWIPDALALWINAALIPIRAIQAFPPPPDSEPPPERVEK